MTARGEGNVELRRDYALFDPEFSLQFIFKVDASGDRGTMET